MPFGYNRLCRFTRSHLFDAGPNTLGHTCVQDVWKLETLALRLPVTCVRLEGSLLTFVSLTRFRVVEAGVGFEPTVYWL